MFAALWASIESSMVQHPLEPVRKVPEFLERAKCTPTTSWPASTARAAATAESTPPDMAAKTFILISLLFYLEGSPAFFAPAYAAGNAAIKEFTSS